MTQGFIHHIHKRKIQHKELAHYPSPDPKIRLLDLAILAVAVIGPMANIPQIIQLYSSRDAGSLSIITWLFFVLFNLLWMLYGIAHKEKLIMTASISAVIFQIPIIIGILIY